jgi:S-adenosylmethionine decarboxylase
LTFDGGYGTLRAGLINKIKNKYVWLIMKLKFKKKTRMKDLAPMIYRQRMVIEGYPAQPITDAHIKDYLVKLSQHLRMHTLIDPVTHRSDKYGWAGWTHWENSGAHFYAWEQPLLFFSVDIYTCKAFKPEVALEFTKNYFQATALEYKEF